MHFTHVFRPILVNEFSLDCYLITVVGTFIVLGMYPVLGSLGCLHFITKSLLFSSYFALFLWH